MIPFRSEPFSDRALHFIDGAVDQGEITLATAIALKLHGDPAAVLAALPRERSAEEIALAAAQLPQSGVRMWMSPRFASCMALARMAEAIISELEPRRRGAIVQVAFPHMVQNVASLAQVYACWAFEDGRRGGCLLPWRKRWLCRRDGRPTRKFARRLRSPSWIARYVRLHAGDGVDGARDVCRHFLAMRDRWRGSGADEADAMALTDDLERVEAACRRGGAPLPAKSTRRLLAAAWRDRQAARKVVKRGARIAAAVVGEAAVGAFTRGEFVELEGARSILAIRRGEGASILDHGHGALDVRLLDRGRRRVADLCVYLPGTPVIDHLAGMALYVQSGDEDALIAAANVVRVHAAGHELLPARKIVSGTPLEPPRRRGHQHFSGTWEEERALQDEYWRESQRLWIDALGFHCMGRSWKSLSGFFAEAAR